MDSKFKKENYTNTAKTYYPKVPYFKNCLKAFLVGGFICLIGELLTKFYMQIFDMTQQEAGTPTVTTLILLSSLLTGFGVYDRIAQFAGAGSAVPVTGFANAVTSAALEYKSEGYVLGVGSNMFKLAGSVIVFGVTSAYIVGIIRYVFSQLIGG
ncbi:stage V sporulation protein AC [Terribacillus saccharophilus]|uniref:stage V sporulation protein AC n=1 Tax=Terribacillus saccharophilus TaxID=361277 RepID=UPI003981F6B9